MLGVLSRPSLPNKPIFSKAYDGATSSHLNKAVGSLLPRPWIADCVTDELFSFFLIGLDEIRGGGESKTQRFTATIQEYFMSMLMYQNS